MEQQPKMPIKKFSAGGITATIWKNITQKDGQEVTNHSVNVDKRYTDKAGEWKTTTTFNRRDIPKAQLVLAKAYEFLTLKKDI